MTKTQIDPNQISVLVTPAFNDEPTANAAVKTSESATEANNFLFIGMDADDYIDFGVYRFRRSVFNVTETELTAINRAASSGLTKIFHVG